METTHNFTAVFERFNLNVVELNVRWQMLHDLRSPVQNLSTMHDTAPLFFQKLLSILADSLVSSIARFCDVKSDSLSIRHVVSYREVDPFRARVEKEADAVLAAYAKNVKKWRNKKVSHADIKHELGIKKLSPLAFAELGELVEGISKVARTIYAETKQVDINYRVAMGRWVPDLMKYLNLGLEAERQRIDQR
jgi:hypothetical protein